MIYSEIISLNALSLKSFHRRNQVNIEECNVIIFAVSCVIQVGIILKYTILWDKSLYLELWKWRINNNESHNTCQVLYNVRALFNFQLTRAYQRLANVQISFRMLVLLPLFQPTLCIPEPFCHFFRYTIYI